MRSLYAADIRYTDEAIEMLVVWLREKLGDDWLIVFSSDHGESLGEHDFFYDHGDYVYNASLRVPLGFAFPSGHPLHGARRVGDWVSLVDVAPTLVELMDLTPPEGLEYEIEGRSLVPYFLGETLEARPVFAECGHSYHPDLVRRRVQFDVPGRFRAVIHGRWKLIWTPGQSQDLEYEFYDVVSDPDEGEDLFEASHGATDELKLGLRRWLERDAGSGPMQLSDEDRERLRSLGYVGD